MIQHELQPEIDQFKEACTEIYTGMFLRLKELMPQSCLLTYNRERKRFTMQVVIIPPTFFDFQNEAGKSMFAKVFLPAVIDGMNKAGEQVICLCLAHESWMRKVAAEKVPNGPNARKIAMELAQKAEPIEMLTITFETEIGATMINRPILRDGKAVSLGDPNTGDTANGDEITGRFQHILRKQFVTAN